MKDCGKMLSKEGTEKLYTNFFLSFCFVLVINLNFVTFGTSVIVDVESESFQVYKTESINQPESFQINGSTLNAHKVFLNLSQTNITDFTRVNIIVETSVERDVGYETEYGEKDCPVIFSIRHMRNAKSWALPLHVSRETSSQLPLILYEASHSVCLEPRTSDLRNDEEAQISFQILVSTCSPLNVTYSLDIKAHEDPLANALSEFRVENIELSPSISRSYKYEFDDNTERIIVDIDSADYVCMTVAIQSPWCSLVNVDSDAVFERNGVEFQKLWQDMTTKAVIPVSKGDFQDGFFLAFAVHGNNKPCKHYNGVSPDKWAPIKTLDAGAPSPRNSNSNRTKVVSITVSKAISSTVDFLPWFYPFFFSVIIIGVTAVIFTIFDNPKIPYLGDGGERTSSEPQGERINEGGSSYLLDNDEVDIAFQNASTSSFPQAQERRFLSSQSTPVLVDLEPSEPQDGREQEPIRTISGPMLDLEFGFGSGSNEGESSTSTFQRRENPFSPSQGTLHSSLVHVDTGDRNSQPGLSYQPAIIQRKGKNNTNARTINPGTRDQSQSQPQRQVHILDRDNISNSSSSSSSNGSESSQNHRARGNKLTIQDFVHKTKKLTSKTMDRIYLLIITVGIFYVLPTVQLLVSYRQIKASTGESDLCYQNFMCSRMLFGYADANHVVSNGVYIVCGVAFLIFAAGYRRKISKLEAARISIDLSANQPATVVGYGVIHQFGVFLSLGLSLVLEGVLSGLYHMCASPLNYQFDTSFMYILAVMTGIKIYQFRHWNPVCSLNTIWFLAIIAFVSVGGLILGSRIYEGLFFLLHFLVVSYLSIYMYYIGHVRDDDENAITSFWKMVKKAGLKDTLKYPCSCFKPAHPMRLLYVIPFITVNIVVDVWQFNATAEFPTYLLYMFCGNMMWYFTYYFTMKLFHLELFNIRSLQPLIYLLLSIVLGITAVLYFLDKRYDTNLSPAESRTLNKKCELAMWDSHDIWHVLSAGSIFLFFMCLLTLDDALLNTQRTEIVAF